MTESERAHFRLLQILPVRTIPARVKAPERMGGRQLSKLEEARKSRIIALRATGMKQREIGVAVGISKQAVGRVLKHA